MHGQVVIGPPGSGKSTYCSGVKQFLSALDHNVAIINLDPANHAPPYEAAVDIATLISLEDVMDTMELGPNGGLVYCAEFLHKNMAWLEAALKPFMDHYLLFDLPGQVELYTHHSTLRNIVDTVQKWGIRLVSVHLMDSHYCNEASKYLSGVMVSLASMVSLELPHINVLSKIDLLQSSEQQFTLDYYCNAQDLSHLVEGLSADPMSKHYTALNEAICGVIEDYSLVSYCTLDISNKLSIFTVLKKVDQAGGQGLFDKDLDEIDVEQAMDEAVDIYKPV